MKTGFIGVGNMGGAILQGYAKSPESAKDRIMICDANKARCEALRTKIPKLAVAGEISDLVKASDVIVLGVKPQIIEEVMDEVAKYYKKDKVIVSMAAGISIDYLCRFLGKDAKIVRIMPNTPAMVGEAMIAMCPYGALTLAELMDVEKILKSVGRVEEVSESLIDCVIGVSGSSPAYTFMYIEALTQAATANGMDPQTARTFAAQAVLGAAKLVLESPESLEQLRTNVCSPGGTTIKAVKKLEANGFMQDVKEAFQAAYDRSKEMTRQKG